MKVDQQCECGMGKRDKFHLELNPSALRVKHIRKESMEPDCLKDRLVRCAKVSQLNL